MPAQKHIESVAAGGVPAEWRKHVGPGNAGGVKIRCAGGCGAALYAADLAALARNLRVADWHVYQEQPVCGATCAPIIRQGDTSELFPLSPSAAIAARAGDA